MLTVVEYELIGVPGPENLDPKIDPALYLDTLRQLKSAVTRVAVVHHARQPLLIESIVQAGIRQGLTIEPVAVNDVDTAVRAVNRLLTTADPDTTALWFTPGTLEIAPTLLLPFVLEESWRRRLAVFSGDTAHTRRGFLFALYPDYVGLGRELGQAIDDLDTLPPGTLTDTRAARLALNRRTARHLGLAPDRSLLERADLIFPIP
ncbi:MAG: hypothetical protein R3310_16465 [Candidatus Competibacteraceae bacterium]|nr:hypothetical protein [Candidatus Competibacteraceae bacterium]